MKFTTRDQYKATVTASLGEYAAEHDIEAIVDATSVPGPKRGWQQVVDTDMFWQIVSLNAASA
jgi:hypothetical protein